jgi:predicted nucleotidyltransferase component of viral defense system
VIPRPALTQWRQQVPWQTDLQVEQDLLLSILAIRVAAHPYLCDRLVWRGGTCLHKLHLAAPWRYSEDLDYVLVGENPDHGRVANALREVVADIGMGVHHSDVTPTRVNVYADTEATVGGARIRIKLEVNCADAQPVLNLVHLPHSVTTRWRSESADVLTFQAPELIGTKLRALAQRRKGRDLSDTWLARRELTINDTDLAVAGHQYLNHEGIEPARLRQQVAAHTTDRDFTHDLDPLPQIHTTASTSWNRPTS